MNPARPTTHFDPRLPRRIGFSLAGSFLLFALGPFAIYGREYLYIWMFLDLPFVWLPLGSVLPTELLCLLGVTVLAASTWGVVGYLVAGCLCRRFSVR